MHDATDHLPEPAAPAPTAPAPGPFWRAVHLLEDTVLALAIGGILVLPLIGMVLRQFETALAGGSALTQNLTLFVSMAGGALAARQVRLLTISQGFAQARAPWGLLFELTRAGISAGISLLLAWACWGFLLAEREGGASIAYGIPAWVPLLALVAGFAVIALRLIHHAGTTWHRRVVAAVLALALTAIVLAIEPESWALPLALLALLLGSVVVGAPIFVLLGGAALLLAWGSGTPLASLPISHYSLATNSTIPALPLFTLAGYFLSEGGTSRRMIRLLRAIVGDLRSGPAVVTVAACAFFTSLTGASGVTILALGGLLVPFLVSSRYREGDAIGLLTGSGALGLLFAPCLPLILYAIVAKVQVEAMFLAGIIPGTALAVATAAWGTWKRPAGAEAARPWRFEPREIAAAAWDAKWELLVPVVSLGSIFTALATPVEAAALTAVYALFTQTAIYRDLPLRRIPGVATECGLLIGGVLLILGVAQEFTNYLIEAEAPTLLVDFVRAHVDSPVAFIALLTLALLVVGCLMDVFSAIVVVVPLIVPLGLAYGLSPVHLGILFLANLGLGFLTPPVGMNLFLASYRFRKPMREVLSVTLPYFWIQLVVVLVISYWPALSTWLPARFGFAP